MKPCLKIALSAAVSLAVVVRALSDDLIVSANDAKYVRVAGTDTYPSGTGPDTLSLLLVSPADVSVKATVEVEHSIAGPPQAVAITPDGTLAVVSAPSRYDRANQRLIFDTFLQVVDLKALPPRVVSRVELGSHPQGLAINRTGSLLLAATVAGDVAVLAIRGMNLAVVGRVKVSNGRLAGISFTHDGRSALVCRRDEQGVAVLNVDEGRVSDSGELISSGVAPYSIDVSSEGNLGVVSNAGLAGLKGTSLLPGDRDCCTLIDLSRRPFQALQYLNVPALPEGAAISPDGRWIAVQSMDGSNLPRSNPQRREHGRVLLFSVLGKRAELVSDLPGGEAAQGIVFTADSRRILVQFNIEKQIAVYQIEAGRLRDTGKRISVLGGPASLRSMPR